jgi:hypothetical protein
MVDNVRDDTNEVDIQEMDGAVLRKSAQQGKHALPLSSFCLTISFFQCKLKI